MTTYLYGLNGEVTHFGAVAKGEVNWSDVRSLPNC